MNRNVSVNASASEDGVSSQNYLLHQDLLLPPTHALSSTSALQDVLYAANSFELASLLLDAAAQTAVASETRTRHIEHIWGGPSEPPYHPCAEDRASLFARFTYTWIGDFIYRAAREELSAVTLPPATRHARTWNCGSRMSNEMNRQLEDRRKWDSLCDAVAVGLVQEGVDASTRCFSNGRQAAHPRRRIGVLRWVGYLQRSQLYKPDVLLGGVEWCGVEDEDDDSATEPVEHRNFGKVGGERLFRTAARPTTSAAARRSVADTTTTTLSADGRPTNVDDDASDDEEVGGAGPAGFYPIETLELLLPTDALWGAFAASGGCLRRGRGATSNRTISAAECVSAITGLVEHIGGGGLGGAEGARRGGDRKHEHHGWRLVPPKRPSAFRAMLRVHLGILLPQVPFKAIADYMTLSYPLILEYLVVFLTDDDPNVSVGVGLIVMVLVFNLIQTACSQKYYDLSIQSGLVVRSSFLGYIFEKCFLISQKAMTHPEMGIGRIVNMVSTDVERSNDFCWYAMYLWSSPQMLIISIGLLYRLVGWCAIAGLAAMVVTMPFQGWMARRQQQLRLSLSKLTDRRVKVTTEMLSGMRIVKFMAWEQEFIERIQNVRREELLILKEIQLFRVLMSLMNVAGPALVIATVLVLYHVSGHTLTARVVFPTISLLNLMRMPFMMIPFVFTAFIQLFVAMSRITRFVECEDDKAAQVRNITEWQQQQQQDDVDGKATALPLCTYAVVFDEASLAAYVPSKLPALLGGVGVAEAGHLQAISRRLRASCCCCTCRATSKRQQQKNNSKRRTPTSINDERQPLLGGGPAAASSAASTSETRTFGATSSAAFVSATTFSTKFVAKGTPEDGVRTKGGAQGTIDAEKPKLSERQPESPSPSRKNKTKKEEEEAYELSQKVLLRELSFKIPAGKLTIVVGPTGSGKSTLLDALIGQFDVIHGNIFAPTTTTTTTTASSGGGSGGTMAYAPQQPWVMNATLKNNITFFTPFDASRFDEAIRVCELEADILTLVDGVETEIGEKGVTLSGGQKARVGLARAVYAHRDIYLLDDPLSALDAHVSSAIMERCICGALSGTTRVLCTHQTHVLPQADSIIVLNEKGRVCFQGSYGEYLEHPTAAREMTTETTMSPLTRPTHTGTTPAGAAPFPADGGASFNSAVLSDDEEELDVDLDEADADKLIAEAIENSDEGGSAAAVHKTETCTESSPSKNDASSPSVSVSATGLMSTEEKAVGAVPLATYRRYIDAGGGLRVAVLLLAVFTVTEVLAVSSSVWLSIWSVQSYGLSQSTYLYIFLGCVGASILCSPLRFYVAYDAMRLASLNLHQSVLYSIASAPMSFFDTTPLGRIINRFSRDIDMCDNTLQMSFIFMLQTIFSALSTTCVMIVSQPFALVALVPCGVVYYRLMVFYNSANREVRRIASIIKSPMVALLNESLTGSRTIRAYGADHAMMQEALSRLDTVYAAGYMQNVANRWLGTRIELLANFIITTIAFFAVVGKLCHFGPSNVGLISLGFTMALSITQVLNWIVRQVAAVEADMNSVERLVYYTDEISREDVPELTSRVHSHCKRLGPPVRSKGTQCNALDISTAGASVGDVGQEASDTRPQSLWTGSAAARGTVVIRYVNVAMRYRPGLPLVLNGLSFDIRAGEKVGVVGRTGSGKSSLLLTFLRIVECERSSSSAAAGDGETTMMEVLGKNMQDYELHDLRRLFAMIPQDPLLFDGTVRSNLDPFGECTNEEMIDALTKVGMYQRLEGEGMLEAVVLEQGSNYSVGQRQLLCLARALLRRGSRFVLMDEATANIDPGLDRLIQRTVKTALAEHTVITIAHRLHTVLEYETILVLDKGKVAESGRPWVLAKDRRSILRKMISSHGPAVEERLMKLLEKSRRHHERDADHVDS